MVFLFYSSVASHAPKFGVVIPLIIKRVFVLGVSSDRLKPEAREIAELFNDYLHDKTV